MQVKEKEMQGGGGESKTSRMLFPPHSYLLENSVDPFMAYFSYFVKSAI